MVVYVLRRVVQGLLTWRGLPASWGLELIIVLPLLNLLQMMPSHVVEAGLLDLYLPDLFFLERIGVVDDGIRFDHDVGSGVFERGCLDHIRDALCPHLHLQISQLLLLQLLLVVIAKRVDRRWPSFHLKLFGHSLIFFPLHLRLIVVLAILTPLVTHVAVCGLLICQLANARFLLLCVHLALKAGHLLAGVQCLVHLRGHIIVILLLSFTLFQSRTVLLSLELLVPMILSSSIGLIHIALRLLSHLHLGEAGLVLPLTILLDHH